MGKRSRTCSVQPWTLKDLKVNLYYPHPPACPQASPGPRGGHYDRDERLAPRSETDGRVTGEEDEQEEEEEEDRTQ
ncbi:unnamed protein product [Merluccius merluccius]